SAELFFNRLLRLQPEHALAHSSAPWSGRAWTPTRQGAAAASGGEAVGPLGRLRAQLAARMGAYTFITYLAGYMLAITLAELATTFFSPHLGLVIHGGLLVMMLLHASFWADASERNFLLALGLAPLIRLMSLSMPLLQFDFMYWYMVIGIPLLISTVVVYRLGGYRPGQVGLALGKNLPLQLGIALGGVGLGYLEYLILRPEPLVASLSLESIWLPALILLVFTGFLEELIFRGLMQRASADTLKKLGPWYISLLFAVLHIGYKSWIDLAFVFVVGYVFSLVAERTRSIWGVTLAHGLTNISLFLIFPFIIAAPLAPSLPPEQAPLIAETAAPAGGLAAESTAQPTATRQAVLPDIFMAPPTPTARPTRTPTASPTAIPSETPTATPTQTLTPTPCVVRSDWVRYTVQPGDTLASLRQLYDLKKVELLDGNCLSRDLEELKVGQVIYVPFLPPTPVPPTPVQPRPTKPPPVIVQPPVFRPTPTPAPPSTRP
ncbi:MAG TPA: CPBP family glutamic-type intramembrane protease, partial [Rubrivivax sp.]|nr:CPBP family glutamic-type intramembrane protease [Rubrivivax sp.]